MNRSFKNYLLFVTIIIYVILYKLFIFSKYMKYSMFINASFMIIICMLSIMLLGFRKSKKIVLKKNINYIVLICLTFAILLIWGIGFFTNFLVNAYSLKFLSIMDNIVGPIFIIIFSEIFRYVVIQSSKDKKEIPMIITIVLIIFELAISYRYLKINTFSDIFYTFSRDVLPITIKNIMLSYICYYAGYNAPILYRLITEIYIYIVPLVPNIGDYLNIMISILLPSVILIYTFGMVEEYNNGVEHVFHKDGFKIIDVPIYAIIIMLLCLASGFFPHTIMGVGSNSMVPYMQKGDVVIIKHVDQSEIRRGDIIAYKNNNKVVIHRLIKIRKENHEKIYKTKGDANNGEDVLDIKYNDIKGKVVLKIPYIGYPSVLLTELLR